MIPVDAIIAVAMPDEAAPFVERADAVGAPVQVGHAEHRVLVHGGRSLLLVRTGIGLVNAATAVAVAISGSRPRAVVSAGSAGGVDPTIRVGDVVVGAEYRYTGADARAFGYELGQVPGMPPAFLGDSGLLDAVPAEPPLEAPSGVRLRTGTMLSGDAFVDAGAVEGLRTAFPQGLSTDMESAALAHACHQYGVPFVSVRGISDLCGPVAGEDFLTHVDDAAERSAAVVLAALAAVTA